MMEMLTVLNLIPLFFLCLASSSHANDAITPNQPFKDTGKTITSPGRQFELGYFNLGSSPTGRYLGIRYNDFAKDTIIWVANRNTPLNDTSGVLALTPQGILRLTTTSSISSSRLIWWTNVSSPGTAKNPIARLLDTGNLVVGDSHSSLDYDGDYLWESFDYPGSTFMPTMKFGKNLVTGLDTYLSSWKADDDPSEGLYTYKFDTSGYPQLFLRRGNKTIFRGGPWNGERFSGSPNLKPNKIYTYEFVINEKEIYYRYNLVSKVVTRMVLRTNGAFERWIWVERTGAWILYLTALMDSCDRLNLCGSYGSCNVNNSPSCGCLDGFVPKDPLAWNAADWNDGCVRRVKLGCGSDGFKRISGLKFPDTRKAFYDNSLSLKECERLCSENCSCTAFAKLDIRKDGSGCLMWFDELNDLRYCNDGQDLYVRMAASELGNGSDGRKFVSILVPVFAIGAIFICLWLFLHKRKQKKLRSEGRMQPEEKDIELSLFSFSEIDKATGNFSLENKLGQGGFGLVYKGILNDGQEIAVKRLSKNSNQGVIELKNEASCIAKLQHRNLVKLLGCCIQKEEKMLVYEYMPNSSLDLLIFDQPKWSQVDWPKRLNIINGITRGLLYLHHDSRLRIIHRDLKASNILLDHNLNPKISDFGMARIFGGDETDQANTNRIVGTYGYMAPEYAVDGIFSVKSDVFSFGVLVLEIVSGKKNRGFSHPNHDLNLLGHAWRLYNDGRSLELLDLSVKESCDLSQVLRVIHVSLLCVQQSPEDRPNMSMVVLMLGSSISLRVPKEPGFFTERKVSDPSSSSSNMLDKSVNEISITFMDAR